MSPKIYSLLKRIPKGKVTTYGELAKATKLHSRTVGMLMKKNERPDEFPCYKVVKSDGSIGGYSGKGGIITKIKLLEKDGISVKKGKIDLKNCLFRF